MKKKVYVGLSGGVDSAVCAALLLQQGYDVTAIFMKNWSGEDYGISDQCPWEVDLADSIAVAKHLGIEHKTYNFEKEYRELVMEEFFKGYQNGETPNPDILCNKFIKFKLFLERCISDGADLIATGHYANTLNGELFRPKDQNKDQTYFLSEVDSESLKKTLFPLADYTKPEVRELARKFKLPNAERKDSQGICFVGKVDMGEFLRERIKEKVGEFIDIDSGEVIGEHNGIYFYTIGQRKGLDIGGLSEPYFVCKKDVDKNIVYLAKGREHPALWSKEIKFKNLHLINQKYHGDLTESSEIFASIRYRSEASKVLVDIQNQTAKFETDQWAPAKGQIIVFYQNDRCLGAAEIV